MVQWFNYALFSFYPDSLILFSQWTYLTFTQILHLLVERKITEPSLFLPSLIYKVIPGRLFSVVLWRIPEMQTLQEPVSLVNHSVNLPTRGPQKATDSIIWMEGLLVIMCFPARQGPAVRRLCALWAVPPVVEMRSADEPNSCLATFMLTDIPLLLPQSHLL